MKNADQPFLERAIEKAKESVAKGGFPSGAILVKDGEVIGEGLCLGGALHDPTSHGEIAAIRSACATLKTTELKDAVLYAAMSPCVMCLSAAMWSGVVRIVYALAQEKVAAQYYGGHYEMAALNNTFLTPIKLDHLKKLEPEALAIVRAWEKQWAAPKVG
ncbi:MAG: nucleoside deaminase [Bdellovibrionales bacterium]|jgi:tRNA(Arg) A34 adenosine deaminase TadA